MKTLNNLYSDPGSLCAYLSLRDLARGSRWDTGCEEGDQTAPETLRPNKASTGVAEWDNVFIQHVLFELP